MGYALATGHTHLSAPVPPQLFANHAAFVTKPKFTAPGKPWVWRTSFPDYHAELDRELLAQGPRHGAVLWHSRLLVYSRHCVLCHHPDLHAVRGVEPLARGGHRTSDCLPRMNPSLNPSEPQIAVHLALVDKSFRNGECWPA
jgi:hypothetical protein